MALLSPTAERIDLTLLDEVEQRLQELIDSSSKIDLAEAEVLEATTPSTRHDPETQRSVQQDRLQELSRQTAELERELTSQEQSLRSWLEMIDERKKLLRNLPGS